MLGAFLRDEIRQRGRYHHRAVVVCDDDVVREDRAAAAGAWLVQEVEKGAKLPGLYPPNEENKARYEAWKKSR